MKKIIILFALTCSASAFAGEACVYAYQEFPNQQKSAWFTCAGNPSTMLDASSGPPSKSGHLTMLINQGYKLINCSISYAGNGTAQNTFVTNECIFTKQ